MDCQLSRCFLCCTVCCTVGMHCGDAEDVMRMLKETQLTDRRARAAEAALTNELRSSERYEALCRQF